MKKLFLTMTIALLSSGAIYAQPASTETRVQRVVAVKNEHVRPSCAPSESCWRVPACWSPAATTNT